jgi:hypothetical protein
VLHYTKLNCPPTTNFLFCISNQLNSFLQSLRGVLKSGTTKVCFIALIIITLILHQHTIFTVTNIVDSLALNIKKTFFSNPQLSTFMLWMDLFMCEWNKRKHETNDVRRNSTIQALKQHPLFKEQLGTQQL